MQLQHSPRSRSAAALTTTLGVAAASWVVAVRLMSGMDMGAETRLGSFAFFVCVWAAMMAAMMLPGAAPAALRRARTSSRLGAVPLFVGSYLAVWMLVGIAVYALYRPHGSLAAGVVVIAAGTYELTPRKQRFRARCRERVGSGFEYGLCCVGSSIGLMLILVALSVMSVTWMLAIAVLGLALVALGVLIIVAPSSVPGFTAPM
jgi:predicted metal-binding membrane protein